MYAPLRWVLEIWLKYNPFFIYANRDPLLHQTELVARALVIRPLRLFIGDSIGLGKTVEAIRILRTIERYRKIDHVLVLVPSTLVAQWAEEFRQSGIKVEVLNRDKLMQLKRLPTVPPGWYVGSIDTLKRKEYSDVIKDVKWDAVIVDEAHRVGVPGREPNQRWKLLADLVTKEDGRNAIVLLLSATPHRGKAFDYLLRFGLLDPVLLDLTGPTSAIADTFDNNEFYKYTQNVILFRRTKNDVNTIYEIEKGPIFKDCIMHAVIVEPSPKQSDYMVLVDQLTRIYLESYYDWYSSIAYDGEVKLQGVKALLRAVLIKRALSSPESARHTFERIILKRGLVTKLIEQGGIAIDKAKEEAEKSLVKILEKYREALRRAEEDYMSDDVTDTEVEEEPDAIFDTLAEMYAEMVDDENVIKKLERLRDLAKEIEEYDEVDRKLETLKKIIDLVVFTDPKEVEKLPDEKREKYREFLSGKIVIFTEFKDTTRYLEWKLRKWLKEKYGDDNTLRVLTSENKHELEDIIEWLKKSRKAILIATDVGSEGLNLQYANVLVNYDIAWSPLKLEQRVGRLWRYGQQKTVYVFNLFLAHGFERKVFDVVYQKLYGMTQSVGKIDVLLGEKVYYSAFQSELLEKATGGDTWLAGLIPLELDEKHRLTETTIINMIADDVKNFVEHFMKALKKLEEQARKVYPRSPDRKSVEEFLHSLTGFRNNEEVWTVVKRLADLFEVKHPERYRNPEFALEEILFKIRGQNNSHIYVYQSESREIVVLTAGGLKVCKRGICEVAYKEPVAVIIGENGFKDILRGAELLDKLLTILNSSIPVDETYGLDLVLNAVNTFLVEHRGNIEASYQDKYFKKISDYVRKLAEYEKNRYALANVKIQEPYFFTNMLAYIESKYAYIFISTSLLPSIRTRQSNEVWFWLEDLALKHVVDYERSKGREPVVVKSAEHYDVRSVGVGEERFIEVKAPTSNKISVALTEREFESAKKYGDRYWLYIVFGADSDKPVILCIRNPVNRLKFVREEHIEKQTRYVVEV